MNKHQYITTDLLPHTKQCLPYRTRNRAPRKSAYTAGYWGKTVSLL